MECKDGFTVNHEIKSVFGVGCSAQVGETARSLGIKRALLICDAALAQLGLAEKVTGPLREQGIAYKLYQDIRSEPASAQMNEIAALAREWQADGVIGLGGGSALDMAKGTGLLLSNPGQIEEYIGVNRGKRPIAKVAPVILLPTTSGTSAEVTPVFVVSESASGKKTGAVYRGSAALIDPEFMLGVPPFVTAFTGMDMLSHATESLTNPKPNPVSDLLDLEAIRLIFAYLPRAFANGADLEARTQLAYAGLLTGYAFADKGTHIGHSIADKISNKYHYNHGLGCAMGLMAAIRYGAYKCPEQLRRIARALELPAANDPNDLVLGQAVVAAYVALRRQLGLKSIREAGVEPEYIDFIIKTTPEDVRFKNKPWQPDYALAAQALWAEYEQD